MIRIYEVKGEDKLRELAARFDCERSPGDRCFAMEEEGVIGFAAAGLVGAAVEIKAVEAPGLPFAYYDLLARSLLNALCNLAPIKIRVNFAKDYFAGFGFKSTTDGMEILNTDVDFRGACRGKED